MSLFRCQEPLEAISDINVVPLADVSLVLLIILLLLSPMMAQNMLRVRTAARTEAPPPAQETPPAPELVLVVSLGPGGVAIGERLFSERGPFLEALREELAGRSDRKVFLSPHPLIPHGLVVETLEMIKSCGADSVALVQAQEEGDGLPPAQAAP